MGEATHCGSEGGYLHRHRRNVSKAATVNCLWGYLGQSRKCTSACLSGTNSALISRVVKFLSGIADNGFSW